MASTSNLFGLSVFKAVVPYFEANVLPAEVFAA